MQIIAKLNPNNLSRKAISQLIQRDAVRAILLDEQRSVVLLLVETLNNYQLPGGGVEKGESHEVALKKEVLEETGYNIQVERPIGQIVQFSRELNRQTNSYCYIVKAIGKPEKPKPSKKEIHLGYKVVNLPLDEAINLTNKTSPRTFTALKKAQQLLDLTASDQAD